jgi:hypothetical protein
MTIAHLRTAMIGAVLAALAVPMTALVAPAASATVEGITLPTPYTAGAEDIGPATTGVAPPWMCEPDAPVETAPAGDRTLVVMTCGWPGAHGRIYAAFVTNEGALASPWVILGAGTRRPELRDIARDPVSGDIGVLMHVGFNGSDIGLAKYDAAGQTWTALTPQQANDGMTAPCVVGEVGSAGAGFGAAMRDGTLYAVAPAQRTEQQAPLDVPIGRVDGYRLAWSGAGCQVVSTLVPIVEGPEWAATERFERLTQHEVVDVADRPRLVTSLVRTNGSLDPSDDTSDIVMVDVEDGSIEPLVSDLSGTVSGLDVVKNGAATSILVTRPGAGGVTAYPVDGSDPLLIEGHDGTLPFIDPDRAAEPVMSGSDPQFFDPAFMHWGWEHLYPERRSAQLLASGSTASFIGPGSPDNEPGSGPRSPLAAAVWAEAGQPGGVRVVDLPSSAPTDQVQWRVRDLSQVKVDVRDGVPVLVGQCGTDTTSFRWTCVSTWNQDDGWSAPGAVREGLRPRAVLAGGESPALLAPVSGSRLFSIVRDTTPPSVVLEAETSDALEAGDAVSGTLALDDDLDRSQLSCTLSLNGQLLLEVVPPAFNHVVGFEPATEAAPLAWATSPLDAGTYVVSARCSDRAGNTTEQALSAFTVAPVVPPTTAPPTTEPPTTEPPSTEPPVEPTPQPPNPVRSLKAVPASGRATLSWLPPAADQEHAAHTGYRVELLEVSTVLRRTTLLGVGTTSTVIAGLTNGTTYTVRVMSLSDGHGDGGPVSVVVRPMGVPSSVATIASSPRSGGAVVSWTPPMSASTRAAPTGYRLLLTPANERGQTTFEVGPTARSLALSSLRNGVTYTAKVIPHSASGVGPAKSVYAKPNGAPAKPTAVAVVWKSQGRAVVSWRANSTTAAPVTSFRVYVNGVLKGTVPGSAVRSFTVAGTKKGGRYTFVVQAVNAVGTASTSSGVKVRPIP